jgi:uncharacterized membrane protein YphA (DoxX/SURF4 family)
MATTEAARTNIGSATEQRVAAILFSSGMIAMGTLSIIFRDFAFDWQPVPAFQPGREVLAALCGVIMVAFSVALLYRNTAAIAARVTLAFLLVWLSLKVPALVVAPQMEFVWLGFGEIGMLVAGGLVLFAGLSRLEESAFFGRFTSRRGIRIAQVVFGLSVIPVGLSHLFYGQITASLIPSWMPFRMGLAYVTGVGQVVCGMALLISFLPRLAAFVEAFMLALFAFFVWGPGTWITASPKLAGTPPGFRFPLTAFLITWVIGASALLIAINSAPSKFSSAR